MPQDFEAILNGSWDAIPEPEPLPVGSWLLSGQSAKFKEPVEDKNAYVLFVYKPIEAMDDVDTDKLAELQAKNYDVTSNRIFFRIYVEDASDWAQVRAHLKKHGIDTAGSIMESLKKVRGTKVVAYLDQRSFVNAAGDSVTQNDASNFVTPEA